LIKAQAPVRTLSVETDKKDMKAKLDGKNRENRLSHEHKILQDIIHAVAFYAAVLISFHSVSKSRATRAVETIVFKQILRCV